MEFPIAAAAYRVTIASKLKFCNTFIRRCVHSLFCLLLLACCLLPCAAGSEPTTAIRGATLIDGTGKAPVPNAVVVIRGERIVAAAKAAAIPTGARIIEAAGRTLIPGLIDMHTHVTVQDDLLPFFLANGVTTIRDLGCADEKLAGLIRLRGDLAAHQVTGPRLFLAGPPLDGTPRAANLFMGPAIETAEQARAEVRRQAGLGVDLIKLYRQLDPKVAVAAIEEAHARGLALTWDYRWNYRYALQAAVSGVDGLEHVFYSERSSREEVDDLANSMGARKLFFDPTLIAFRPHDGDVTDDPDYEHLPPALTRFWRGLFWPMETPQEFSLMKNFVRKVQRAGGRILAGTDSPVKYSAPGYGLHHELALLVEAGLTPMQALQAATLTAAQALRRERDLGTIEPGKLADMTLIQGNPLQDIHATKNVRMVFLAGRVYDPKTVLKQ
jgi:imidazolonepropionase-like amidohydrolase